MNESKSALLIKSLLFYVLFGLLLYFGLVQTNILSVSDYIQLVSFVTLGALALFAEPFNKWWSGPELVLLFEKSKPYCFTGPQDLGGNFVTEAVYIRFKVINVGKTPAMRCECSVEEIYEITSSGRIKIDNFQPVNIKWAGGKSNDEYVNISSSEVGVFCSLINISKPHQNVHSPQQFNFVHFNFVRGTWPMNVMLEPKKKYLVRIDITSDNAVQRSTYFEIYWSGKWPDNENNIWNEINVEQQHQQVPANEGIPMASKLSIFQELKRNILEEGMSGFLIRLLLGVFLALIVVSFFSKWFTFVCILLFLFVVLSGSLKIRISALLTFATVVLLLFQSLLQNQDLDLRSKAYVDIQPLQFDMTPASDKNSGTLHILLNIVNSGNLGTIIESLEYIPFSVEGNNFQDRREPINAINLSKLNKEFGVVNWSDLALFPTSPIHPHEILNSPFGETDAKKLGNDNKDVYVWFKVKYRTIGAGKSSYYWIIVKSSDISGKIFNLVKSGFGNRDFVKEYNIS